MSVLALKLKHKHTQHVASPVHRVSQRYHEMGDITYRKLFMSSHCRRATHSTQMLPIKCKESGCPFLSVLWKQGLTGALQLMFSPVRNCVGRLLYIMLF